MTEIILEVKPRKLLHKTQYEAFRSLERFTCIRAGRRWGKTRLAIFVIVLRAIEKYGVYWWVSPSYKVGTPAWRLFKRTLKIWFGKGTSINETERTAILPNGSIIEFKSADNPDSLRGEGLSGLVIDECAQIKDNVWSETLRAALADKQGWAIFIGTPKGRNWFFKLVRDAERGLKDWMALHYTTYDNPFISVDEIEAMRLTMSTREFEQEVMAEFVSEGGLIYHKEWFKDREVPHPHRIHSTWISWDTASTVTTESAYSSGIVLQLTVDLKVFVREVFREKLEFPQLQYRVEELARKYSKFLKGIVIENKSSGISAIQSLRQTADPEIASLIWPYQPKGDKVARGYEASKWSEKGRVILPPHTEEFPWLIDFEDELFSAPDSEYLDQFDAFNQGINFLSNYLSQGLE